MILLSERRIRHWNQRNTPGKMQENMRLFTWLPVVVKERLWVVLPSWKLAWMIPTVMSCTMAAVVVIVAARGPTHDTIKVCPPTNPLCTKSFACFPTSTNNGGPPMLGNKGAFFSLLSVVISKNAQKIHGKPRKFTAKRCEIH